MTRCLYLATFDPTGSTTGTATRGHLFLRAFSRTFETHLVHLTEKHRAGIDHDLMGSLAGVRAVSHSRAGYFAFSPSLYRAAAEEIQRRRIDFIFADFEKSGLYAYLLHRRFRIPYVYNTHNVEFLRYWDFARTNAARYPFVPYLYFAERIAARHAMLTIAISGNDARTFSRWVPPSRLAIIPCAFDERIFHPGYEEVPQERPVVLLVGNYRNAGNRAGALHLYRTVLPQVLARQPQTIFRFVGKDLPEEIRHPNVERLDFVENLELQYRRATVVVAPIQIGGGIKIKVIEALATGRFLVATEKAMEGIPADGIENLRTVPLEQFSESICEALATRPAKTSRNFELLREGFGSHRQLETLTMRIEDSLPARRRAKKAHREASFSSEPPPYRYQQPHLRPGQPVQQPSQGTPP
jgi:glycosyltransferase involved in cell wall biosynthesis